MSEFGGLWKHEETEHAPTVPESQLDEGGHFMKEEEEEVLHYSDDHYEQTQVTSRTTPKGFFCSSHSSTIIAL